MLDRYVTLQHLVRLAADQTQEVIRADRTTHRDGRLDLLFLELFGLDPILPSLSATAVISPARSAVAIWL
jgi:hypothetical protein